MLHSRAADILGSPFLFAVKQFGIFCKRGVKGVRVVIANKLARS